MANKKVTLCWYCKTPRGWRYFPVVYHIEKGMLAPKKGWVNDGGTEVEYPQGRFVTRSYDAERRSVYTPVDTEIPQVAQVQLQTQRIRAIGAKRKSTELLILKSAVAAYIKDCEQRKAMEAAEQARVT